MLLLVRSSPIKNRNYKKKILKRAKGFYGRGKSSYKIARNRIKKAEKNEFISKRLRRRDMRSRFIMRINAACRLLGSNYSRFMHKLNTYPNKDIYLNKKSLFDLIEKDNEDFKNYFDLINKSRT